MHLGWSSRTYPLDAGDFAGVPDYDGPEIPEADLPDDEVVLLIRPGAPDALVRGRAVVAAAAGGTIDVRVVFVPSIAAWNLPFILARFLRDRRRYEGTGVYHIATEAVRQMGLERAVRTLDDPQKRGKVDRLEKMRKLERSLREKGYDDSRPINVMLCRSRGTEDSLRQGHHRISACLACGIEKMAIHFSAAGALPRCIGRLVAKPPVRVDVLRSSLESHLGIPIDKLVPVPAAGSQTCYIVVPQPGGRFVLKLAAERGEALDGRPVEIGGRCLKAVEYGRGRGLGSSLSLAAGVAPAIIVPCLVAGALAIDVAVMKTACGERSLVAWVQFGCALVSSVLVGFAAAGEKRGRAAFAMLSSLFMSMAIYELLRDVYDVMPRWITVAAIAAALLPGAVLAVSSRRSFANGIRTILASPSFHALPFGFVSIWGVSKIMAIRAIWEALPLGSGGVRTVKHIVEEGVELFGYAVIFCWALSFLSSRLAEWRRARL